MWKDTSMHLSNMTGHHRNHWKAPTLGLLLLTLSACKTVTPIINSTLKKDSTITTYTQQEVLFKGAKVAQQLSLDSLLKEMQLQRTRYLLDSADAVRHGKPIPQQVTTEIRYLTDPETKATLSYWTDQYGKLNMACESKDQTVQLLVAQVKQLHTELSTAVKTVDKTPWYNYLIIFTLLAALLLTIIKK